MGSGNTNRSVKLSVICAFLVYLLALLHILDWIFFCNRNKELALKDHYAFKQLYYDHFPDFMKPLLTPDSRIESFVMMLLLVISGFILLKGNRVINKIAGINALLFAAFYLFSLM